MGIAITDFEGLQVACNLVYTNRLYLDIYEQSIQLFLQVLELEAKEKGEWGFKALKQMIKINFKVVCIIFTLDVFDFIHLLKLYINISC